jgi:glutamyl-Q tRNA(Asp) synthetase
MNMVRPDRDMGYRGRFAPSPTGTLHAGSLVAALGSWLDARAHDGTWVVRIEDIDPPREVPGAAREILATLDDVGLVSDEPVLWQHARSEAYRDALDALLASSCAYRCACSRREVELASQARKRPPGVYPGTCRNRALGSDARSVRLRVPDPPADLIAFVDRAAGRHAQPLAHEVGDFVLFRADGLWAYQLAVVVDDGAQQITDVVRGADLIDNTPRQIWLQHCLGLPTPRYLHLPVVTNAQGEKLSKQTGARALDRNDVRGELERAWQHLGFEPLGADSRDSFLRRATDLWRDRWVQA